MLVRMGVAQSQRGARGSCGSVGATSAIRRVEWITPSRGQQRVHRLGYRGAYKTVVGQRLKGWRMRWSEGGHTHSATSARCTAANWASGPTSGDGPRLLDANVHKGHGRVSTRTLTAPALAQKPVRPALAGGVHRSDVTSPGTRSGRGTEPGSSSLPRRGARCGSRRRNHSVPAGSCSGGRPRSSRR